MNEDRYFDGSLKFKCPVCQHDKHTYAEIPPSKLEYEKREDFTTIQCTEHLPITLNYRCYNCEFEWVMFGPDVERVWSEQDEHQNNHV